MGLPDIIVLAIIAAAVIAALAYIIRRKKAGRCIGCSGDCSQCVYKTKEK